MKKQIFRQHCVELADVLAEVTSDTTETIALGVHGTATNIMDKMKATDSNLDPALVKRYKSLTLIEKFIVMQKAIMETVNPELQELAKVKV